VGGRKLLFDPPDNFAKSACPLRSIEPNAGSGWGWDWAEEGLPYHVANELFDDQVGQHRVAILHTLFHHLVA
jgi:hypothetical protein